MLDTQNQDTQNQATQYAEWRQNLPEGVRENPILDKFKSYDDLAKSYIEQQRFLGR